MTTIPQQQQIQNININFNNNEEKNNEKDNNNEKEGELPKKENIEIDNKKEYTEAEINELEYDLALKYDKRTYWQYYFFLLKTKHDLLYAFYNNNDYNSQIIKIDLFFIQFLIFYTINALFFNDDTMHKIYEDQGSFNFVYQLPTIIYSSLISLILNTVLKYFALSNDDILDLKKNTEKENINEKKQSLENKIKIKFILYFVISSLFLFFFWYYLSVFGAVFRNTQVHLIKDTLVSFSLSLIYPFGIYLLPGLFRIPALSDEKKESKCLYKISKILQML